MTWIPRDLAPINISLRNANNERWAHMKLEPHWVPVANHVVDRIIANKARYDLIEAQTKVPWDVVGMIHDRESSLSWLGYLGNGDPWNKKTVNEPSLRGPFSSWESGALDALTKVPPFVVKWTDWTTGGKLALLELYNGLGYAHMGLPSPYIWSGTDQYVKGKYITDHHYDPDAVDHQLGCALMLNQLYERVSNEQGRSRIASGEGAGSNSHHDSNKPPPATGGVVNPSVSG